VSSIKQLSDCSAVVLCGGKSLRMGFDKALLQVNGEYALLKIVQQLEQLFPKVLLVTNDRQKFPPAFLQAAIIEDHYSEKGPLGGLVTALEQLETSHLFLMACDIPQIAVALIEEMALFIHTHEVVICQKESRLEPLFAFYHRSCLPVFLKQLATDDWRIRKEFAQFSVKKIPLKDSYGLKNVNTPEELVFWQ
jgi:molybdopterin-guanine dinucleotide biosynthesis protein A